MLYRMYQVAVQGNNTGRSINQLRLVQVNIHFFNLFTDDFAVRWVLFTEIPT